MIRWCAYCQQFQGEIPPFERWEVSHGICDRCLPGMLGEKGEVAGWTAEQESRIKFLGDINNRFWLAGQQGDSAQMEELVREGLGESIRPIDMLFGWAGPALVRVGELWACNELTVRDEHCFTESVEVFIDIISRHESQTRGLTIADDHRVLLTNVQGNEHTMGLRFVRLGLAHMGLKGIILPPGLPASAIVEQALSLNLSVVGLSISMPSQTGALRAILDAFLAEPAFEGRILIGGAAINAEAVCIDLSPNVQFIARLGFNEDGRALFLPLNVN